MIKKPLESLLTFAAHTFHAYSLVLFRMNKVHSMAEIILGYSRDENFNPNSIIYPGVGMAGWILKNQKPLLTNSFREAPSTLGYYKIDAAPAIGSFFGIPLESGEILCIDSLLKNAFSPETQNEIFAFAEILCKTEKEQSVEQRQIAKEDESHYMEELKLLLNEKTAPKIWKTFLQELLKMLVKNGFEYAALATRKGEDRYFIEAEFPAIKTHSSANSEFSTMEGIVGWTLRNEEPIFNTGVRGKGLLYGISGGLPAFARSACVPIIIDSHACGVLCIGTNGNQNISSEFRQFFLLSAEITAQRMKNYSLRHEILSLKKQLLSQ